MIGDLLRLRSEFLEEARDVDEISDSAETFEVFWLASSLFFFSSSSVPSMILRRTDRPDRVLVSFGMIFSSTGSLSSSLELKRLEKGEIGKFAKSRKVTRQVYTGPVLLF